jgi:hypothetical protein
MSKEAFSHNLGSMGTKEIMASDPGVALAKVICLQGIFAGDPQVRNRGYFSMPRSPSG